MIFDQFDLENHQECTYDHIAVYDGESVDDPALGRFCGSRRPLTLVSSYNMLYLLFHTDATNEKRGFNATHSTGKWKNLKLIMNSFSLCTNYPELALISMFILFHISVIHMELQIQSVVGDCKLI